MRKVTEWLHAAGLLALIVVPIFGIWLTIRAIAHKVGRDHAERVRQEKLEDAVRDLIDSPDSDLAWERVNRFMPSEEAQ